MASAGTDCLSQMTTSLSGDGCLNKGSGVSSMDDHNGDTSGNLNNHLTGKPPRDVSTMRHCSSSSWLAESVSIIKSHVFCLQKKYTILKSFKTCHNI